MRYLYILLFFFLICGSSSAATLPLYMDDFEGNTLNGTMWNTFCTPSKNINISVGNGNLTINSTGTMIQGIETVYDANWTRINIAGLYGPTQTASRYLKISVSDNQSTGFNVSGDKCIPYSGFMVHEESNKLILVEYRNGTSYGAAITSTLSTGEWGPHTLDIFVNSTGCYAIIDYGLLSQVTVSKAGTFNGFTAFAYGQGDYISYAYRTVDIDSIEFYSEYVQPSPPPTVTFTPIENTVSTNHYSTQDFTFSSNQIVNYTFLLDSEIVGSGKGTTGTYENTSNVVGGYNVTVTTFNENMTAGNDTQTWAWTVNELPTEPPEPIFTPSGTTVTQYENLDYDFSLICPNTIASFSWTLNGSHVESTDSEIISEYTLPTQVSGEYEVSVNVSNDAGYDVHTWTVTYLENSMTVDPIFFDASVTNGTAFIFEVSNFTAGIPGHGWAPQNWNHTIANYEYKWAYENGTIIDTQTAQSTGAPIDFIISDVPEGIYRIDVIEKYSPPSTFAQIYWWLRSFLWW